MHHICILQSDYNHATTYESDPLICIFLETYILISVGFKHMQM